MTDTITNFDLIHQAIEEAEKQMTDQPLSEHEFNVLWSVYRARFEELNSAAGWIAEHFHRMAMTIRANNEEIDRLNSKLASQNGIIYAVRKAVKE